MMESRANIAKSFVSINEAKEEWERSKQERDQRVVFLQLKKMFLRKTSYTKQQRKSWRTTLMMRTSMRLKNISAQQSTSYTKNMRR